MEGAGVGSNPTRNTVVEHLTIADMPYMNSYSSLQDAIATSHSWVEVATKIGLSKGSGNRVKERAIKEGLDYSSLEPSHMLSVKKKDFSSPFDDIEPKDRLAHRRSAVGVAIEWFLANNFSASLPVEVEKYDLVVETKVGFRKVQVKSAEVCKNGKYQISLLTTFYNNENKKYEQREYLSDEIDDYFIVCSDGNRYLIPFEAAAGKKKIVVTEKYKEFLVV